MSIPGLGLAAPTPQILAEPESREVILAPNTEWRFEVSQDSPISVKLLPSSSAQTDTDTTNNNENDNDAAFVPSETGGRAEVFGTELAPNHVYEFAGLTKAAIFTHHGCTLSVTGSCESEYVAEETTMMEYMNVHFALENLRTSAEARDSGGPRVLVLGTENAGKTSLVKMLTAYATRAARTPLVINLDPHEGMLTLPSSVSAAVMGTGAVLDIEDAASNGWGSGPIGGPSAVPVKLPLVYQYGYAKPEERPEIYKPVTTRLALAATSRYQHDPEVRGTGYIVDIAGSVCSGKKGADIIAHIVSEFSINTILVLGNERLYAEMSRRFANTAQQSDGENSDEPVYILKLPRSGGCVDRDETYMRQLRLAQIREYFFGGPKMTLSPHTMSVEWGQLNIFRMVDPNTAPSDFLPGDTDLYSPTTGTAHSSTGTIFEPVTTPTLALQSAILAIKHAQPTESHETIRDATVMGWLYVADVDDQKKRLRILSPVGGKVPSEFAMVWGAWEVGVGVGDLLV